MSDKRTDYLSWDEYFMGIAVLSSLRSKDPHTQVGACIVNQDIPWGREGDWMDTKYPYVCHAELNAILNANGNLKGCTLYVDLFPCNECAKAVIQAGISRVVYLSDKYKDSDSTKASKRMFDAAGVSYTHLEVAHKTITLDLAKE